MVHNASMNLIIDVGNTLVKFAVFKERSLMRKMAFELKDFEKQFNSICKIHPELTSAIVASVGYLTKDQIKVIEEKLSLIEVNTSIRLPFANDYKTPQTLGADRVALVAAAVLHYPKTDALIIDAGTCITYDFVSRQTRYLGGAISPGLRLRYTSLNNLTAKLPLLETKLPNSITGDCTEASIHSGVVIGIIKEIDGVIDHYRIKYPDLTVILTGGDAKFLSNQLKNSIFAHSNFLLEGLNFILDYNSN